jgi:hypothetical protein
MEADYLQEMYGVAMREDVDVVICHERAVDADEHPWPEALGAISKMRPSPESAEVDAEEQQRADAPKDDSVPGEPLRIEERKELLRHFQDDFAGMVTWCWNKLYRRELIGDRRFPDLKAMEDLVFNAEVLDGAGKAAWIGRRLYCYRQRKDSVCHRREPFYYEDYGTALRKQNGIMEALGDEEIFERDLSFCLGNLARLETEAEMRKKQEEYSRRTTMMAYVESWLHVLNERERYVVKTQWLGGTTWRELISGFQEQFGDEYSLQGLRKIRDRAFKKICEIAK